MKKRKWLITLCIVLFLVTVLAIIKAIRIDKEHLPDDNSAVSDIVDEGTDDVVWEDDADTSPVVDDYEVELQEDDVAEFR